MKLLKRLGLAGTLAIASICGLASAASATTWDPVLTTFTLTSSNILFSAGGATFGCHSTFTGKTPVSGGGTWSAISGTLTYGNCVGSGGVGSTMTPSEGCHTSTGTPTLHIMGLTGALAVGTLTLPPACNIDINVPAFGCTKTITGGQTLGNGTTGTGGLTWTNFTSSSVLDFGIVTVPNVHATGFGAYCAPVGLRTGILTGSYSVASASNVVVTSGTETAIDPANTEFTLTSTHTTWIIDPENIAVACNDAIVTADTGSSSLTTWPAITITGQTYNNCNLAGLAANVTPSEGCSTAAGRPIMHAMGVSAATAVGLLTLPATCSLDIDVPVTGCTVSITGGQTIGGAGGIDWTNLSPKSAVHFNNADVPFVDSNGTGVFCPPSGAHTGTVASTYNITSTTNITVTR